MHPTRPSFAQTWAYHSNFRGIASLAVGVAVGFALAPLLGGGLAALWGWNAAAAVYVGWIFFAVFRLGASKTRALAESEDPGRFTIDAIVTLASVVSLAGIGLVLARLGDEHRALSAATAGVSIVASWAMLHSTFALSYARLYYHDQDGGIEFHGKSDPSYIDFAYVAFTIGMTFQVSDTDLTSTPIRANALRHALFSYLFGTIIIATAVSLFSSLAK